MRRRVSCAGLVAVLVAVVAGGCADPTEPIENPPRQTQYSLVENGGFESTTELHTSSWTVYNVPVLLQDHVSFARDTEMKHSGFASISISLVSPHPVDTVRYEWYQTPLRYAAPGKTYEYSGWVKTANLSGNAWLEVQAFMQTTPSTVVTFTSADNFILTGTTDWTRLHGTFTVPIETATIRMHLGISGPADGDGTVWFDDVAVTAQPEA